MFVVTIIKIFYAFSVLFIASELGQRVTLAFDGCDGLIDQFKWYLLPKEIQQMLPMVINFTQQPIEIKCFGSVASNRETFKYVSVRVCAPKLSIRSTDFERTIQVQNSRYLFR